jgi:anti-sigma B factor antagonist
MSDTASSLKVRTPAPGIAVIEISGEVTRDSDAALKEAYGQAPDGTRAIVLAFDSLEYMNSSGIGLLVTLLVRAQRNHQQILAYGLSDHYRQIFELTRLDEVIAIHDSETAAIAAAG